MLHDCFIRPDDIECWFSTQLKTLISSVFALRVGTFDADRLGCIFAFDVRMSINQNLFFQAMTNSYNIINVTALERLREKHHAH